MGFRYMPIGIIFANLGKPSMPFEGLLKRGSNYPTACPARSTVTIGTPEQNERFASFRKVFSEVYPEIKAMKLSLTGLDSQEMNREVRIEATNYWKWCNRLRCLSRGSQSRGRIPARQTAQPIPSRFWILHLPASYVCWMEHKWKSRHRYRRRGRLGRSSCFMYDENVRIKCCLWTL